MMSQESPASPAVFDYIIIGGGTAGCVLANRLSAPANVRVLLIEAGRDTPPNLVPEDIADTYAGRAYVNRDYQWTELRAQIRATDDVTTPRRRYEQARIMGGCSSINGQVAVRGASSDYDAWAASGAIGWSWGEVLPYFKRLERDFDYDGPNHNDDGPVPIRRIFPDQWDRLARAAGEVFQKHAYDQVDDLNADYREGYGSLPLNNAYSRRVSTATAYLTPAVRARRNLIIKSGVEVHRIVLDRGAASGVEATEDNIPTRFSGRNVIIAAGAIFAPKLLLVSGIGPAADLSRSGIAVQADLAGVGKGLQDHAAVAISAYLPQGARFDHRIRRHSYINLRYSSGLARCPPVDMVLNPVSRSAWHPLGLQLCTFQAFLAKPFSRGSVRLNGLDPVKSPDVRFNLLSDERDCLRLMDGVRRLERLLSEDPLRSVALDPFPSSYSAAAQSIGKVTHINKFLTRVGKYFMEAPGPIRRQFVKMAISGRVSLAEMVQDVSKLEAFVRNNVSFGWHGCGSCRMGDRNDETVVDPRGRVHGIRGLRVADASIMPEIPRANIAIPTIMLAEKISDHILEDHRERRF